MQILLLPQTAIDVAALSLLEGEHLSAIEVTLKVREQLGLHSATEEIAEHLHAWVVVKFHGLALRQEVDRQPQRPTFIEVAYTDPLRCCTLRLQNANLFQIDLAQQFGDAELLALRLQLFRGPVAVF